MLDEIQTKHDYIEERLINGRLSEQKSEEMHSKLDIEYKELKHRYDKLEEEMQSLMDESNSTIHSNNTFVDYETNDKKERYDIVHAVIDKIMLNRESRYILNVNIYNKVDDVVKTFKIDTYKKNIIIVLVPMVYFIYNSFIIAFLFWTILCPVIEIFICYHIFSVIEYFLTKDEIREYITCIVFFH